MRATAEYCREQITFLGDEEELLKRSSLPAGQHGCDQYDFAKHFLRQHVRDRLSCVDLILVRYEDKFVFGAGDFAGSKQVKERVCYETRQLQSHSLCSSRRLERTELSLDQSFWSACVSLAFPRTFAIRLRL